MLFSSHNGRRFLALLAGMACAFGLMGDCSVAEASIFLPNDAVAIRLHEASRHVDLSFPSRSATTQPRVADTSGQPSSEKGPRFRWLHDFSDVAFNGLTGASSAGGSHVGGSTPFAAIPGGHFRLPPVPSLSRPIATKAVFLAEPVPASLLRPPQAA